MRSHDTTELQSRSVREETFKAWEVLIDNFALSDTVLLSQKRLRLLTRPLVVRTENL